MKQFKIKKSNNKSLSMAHRCHRFFFFFFFFFFLVKKAQSGHGLCCHTFFWVKKEKNKHKQKNEVVTPYRCHRPECLWGVLFKMATTTTIVMWTIEELKEVLSRYVKQNFRRNERLDFVSRDFTEYAWNLRALDRRLEFFNGTTWHTPIEDGRKTRYSLVTGDLVYAVMYDVDPGALAEKSFPI